MNPTTGICTLNYVKHFVNGGAILSHLNVTINNSNRKLTLQHANILKLLYFIVISLNHIPWTMVKITKSMLA